MCILNCRKFITRVQFSVDRWVTRNVVLIKNITRSKTKQKKKILTSVEQYSLDLLCPFAKFRNTLDYSSRDGDNNAIRTFRQPIAAKSWPTPIIRRKRRSKPFDSSGKTAKRGIPRTVTNAVTQCGPSLVKNVDD